jgi:hypothetical protein
VAGRNFDFVMIGDAFNISSGRTAMEELKIVELGDVSRETRGTMVWGKYDPGGVHFYLFAGAVAEHREGGIGRTLRRAFKRSSRYSLD